MASGGSSEEAQLAQCQAYVQRHNIQQLVKEAIVSLCINKPENPILFLKEHFEKLYDQRSQDYEDTILVILPLWRFLTD
ncbi:regulatory subunit of type II PKA R-subunit [Onchocerca flexuosa]|uniref:Regulatory subunit of type II PKA R-subunit n=1 Tax=Onchocerca flexuosa TaxID=387005 RepID=A0A238BXF4_9BILA|nr:regulatory subunit of type II PKA R-subunit [Onchocerca flexuosa]